MEKSFGRRKPVTGGDGRRERASKPFSRDFNKPHFRKREDSEEGATQRRPARRFDRSEDRPARRFDRSEEKRSWHTERRGERPERKFSRDGGRPERHYEHTEYKDRPARKFNRDEPRMQKPCALEWTPAEEFIRLNRFIANSGVCSRREADQFIQTGLVTVNGEKVTELGTKVKMTDDIRFNGERLKGEPRVYLVMNKPKGYVTSMDDPHADKTVMDLISKTACPQRVYPVGRLDKATTGVLMFTNDGELADKLMHPSYGATKIYHVHLGTNLKKSDFDAILNGIELEDGEIHADSLSYVDGDLAQVGIQIHSGRNRIVRRIFEHFGYDVKKLDRVYFAGLTKKALERGTWRFLTETEIAKLKMGSFD